MEYSERPTGACGGCLCVGYLVPMPAKLDGRRVESAPRRRGGVKNAGTLRPSHKAAPYGAPWDDWMLGNPHIGIAFGPPGVGKSTLLARLAVSAARRVPVLFVAAEEGHAATLVERLRRCGLDDIVGQRLSVSDARTLAELDEDMRTTPQEAIVFADSLTELRCKAETLAQTLSGHSWWSTQHITTAGQPRGGLEASHLADFVVEVQKGGVAQPRKNRWGAMGALEIFHEENTL